MTTERSVDTRVHRCGRRVRQGLYDPANEHDACGLGFVAHIKGRKNHAIVRMGFRSSKT